MASRTFCVSELLTGGLSLGASGIGAPTTLKEMRSRKNVENGTVAFMGMTDWRSAISEG
jgi:hypothetical protein